MLTVFIVLLSAHAVGDFLLQTGSLVRNKGKMWVLGIHALLHGVVVYGMMQEWRGWELPLGVVVVHWGIDFLKLRLGGSALVFALDQVMHVVSLGGLAWLAVERGWSEGFRGVGWEWIVGVGGFAAVVYGVGYYIGAVAEEMICANERLREAMKGGLRDGGKLIGRLERAMIFGFILVGEPSAIGFLVAAKMIMRFEEAKQKPVGEYVMIGTMWSYGLAMGLSWLTKQAMGMGVG